MHEVNTIHIVGNNRYECTSEGANAESGRMSDDVDDIEREINELHPIFG